MRKLLFFLMLCGMAGCAMRPVHIQLNASSALNLDAHYRSLPVVVHLYQLQQKESFARADFTSLWRTPQKVLAGDMLAQELIVLDPGESKSVRMNVQAKARYIGAIAIFREPSMTHWKVTKILEKTIPFVPTQMVVHLVGNRIYLR